MKDYKQIMDHVAHKQVMKEVWEEVSEKTDHLLKELGRTFPKQVEEYLKDLEDILLYPPYTEKEARDIVAGFVNKDGTRGGHWSLEEVRDVAKNKPEVKKYDCHDFYITLNMMYSDYYNPKWTMEDYLEFAEDFLGDEDAPKSKLRRYIHAMKH